MQVAPELEVELAELPPAELDSNDTEPPVPPLEPLDAAELLDELDALDVLEALDATPPPRPLELELDAADELVAPDALDDVADELDVAEELAELELSSGWLGRPSPHPSPTPTVRPPSAMRRTAGADVDIVERRMRIRRE